jgi:outer membrane cobalamin receptor
MKFKSLLSILSLILFSNIAFSQEVNVTGKVLDKDVNQPLEYATIAFFSKKENKVITDGITDTQGNFSIDVPVDTYDISIEYISYKTQKILNKSITSDTNLGTINIGINVESLDAVEVIAERTTVEIKLDKKVYNIGRDLTAQGGTVTDALNNIPSVEVDVEGAISLRGNENVRILINGKPSALAGFGSTDVLSQLPADAIERVEVITSPSARYDAEGTAGILNIILRKEKTLGINGSVSANFGYPLNNGISTNVNLRTDKFNLFTTIGHYYRNPPGGAYFDNRYKTRTNDEGEIIEPEFSRIIEDRDFDRHFRGFNGNLGMEYFLTDKSSLTGSVFMRIGDDKETTENLTQRYVDNSLNSETLREEFGREEDKSYQFSLNYENRFNDEGHKLTADLQFANDREDKPTTIQERIITGNNNDLFVSEKIFEIEKQKEYLAQADYVLPMGDAQFEAGYRGNFKEEINDYRLDTLNFDTNEFVLNESLTNAFTYNENVNALYTQYGNKFGKFSFLLGLRLEHTQLKGQVDSDFESIDIEGLSDEIDPNFNKNYFGLFPTVNLIYEIGEKENISLGYNRRINRPRGWFINPFPSRSSRTNIFQGNPDLDPAFSDAFDVGYLKTIGKLTITSSIYYQHETDAFERVQEDTGLLTSEGIAIIRSIPINLSTNKRYGAEAALMFNPYKWLRLNGSFNYFQFETEGSFNGVDYSASNNSWFARFSSKITLPKEIDFQTNMNYSGPRENAQTKTDGVFAINLALSKDIIKNKATVSLNVSDLLNSRKRQQFTSTEFFDSDSEFQWRERQFTLSLLYRFNQPNEKKNGSRDRNGNDNDFEGGDFEG